MGDKIMALIGTPMLVLFNIFLVYFIVSVSPLLPLWVTIAVSVLFGAGAIFFDWKLFKYFKEKLEEKK